MVPPIRQPSVQRFVGTGPKIVYGPAMFPEMSSMVRPDVEILFVHPDGGLF